MGLFPANLQTDGRALEAGRHSISLSLYTSKRGPMRWPDGSSPAIKVIN